MISSNWKEVLEPVDYVRSGVLFVAFVATAFGSAETWIQTDTLAMALCGSAWVLFPNQLLAMQTDVKLDYLHSVFAQTLGVFMLSLAAFNYLNRKSRDPNVWLGVFMSRVMGGSAQLVTQLMAVSGSRDKKGWTLQFVTLTVFGTILFLLANMVQTWKSSTYASLSGKRGIADHLSKHILICAVLEILVLFQMYSHLETLNFLLEKPVTFDLVQTDLAKNVACLMLASFLLTLAALNFEDNSARKSLLLVKTVFLVCLLALDISLQMRYKIYKAGFFWKYIPYLAVTGLGYFHAAKHV